MQFSIDQFLRQFVFHQEETLLFTSGLFLFFFLGFMVVYYFTYPHERLRIAWVTLFSLYFYYKCAGYYWILHVVLVVVDYHLARWMERSDSLARKRWLLAGSVALNLGLLAYFKYTPYFVDTWNTLSGDNFRSWDILIPVGVSFFTFQSLSYTIDVYRGELKALDNMMDYAFFVTFFPQMVAGPIVRAADFLPQIKRPVWVSREDFGRGVFLFATGMFKKAVIADYISINFVDRVFDSPLQYSGLENLMAVYGYALQIYCDFSGYSDMAIGIALLMGFHFPINFDSPYQSASVTEFWRRWHISLSTWLRDYLYIPLGGNRDSSWGTWFFPGLFMSITLLVSVWQGVREGAWWMLGVWVFTLLIFLAPPLARRDRQGVATNLNLMTTMLLGGFWHGAHNRYILWGALHGVALAAERVWKGWFPNKPGLFRRTLGAVWAFHFVCFCWIFFRAKDIPTVMAILSQIAFVFNPQILPEFIAGYAPVVFWMSVGYFLHFLPRKSEEIAQRWVTRMPLLAKAAMIMLVIMLVMQVKSSDVQPFIYFQF